MIYLFLHVTSILSTSSITTIYKDTIPLKFDFGVWRLPPLSGHFEYNVKNLTVCDANANLFGTKTSMKMTHTHITKKKLKIKGKIDRGRN